MAILKAARRFSFESGLTNYWPLSIDTLFASGSPLDFGTRAQYGTASGAGVKTDPNGPTPKIKSGLSFNGTDYVQLSAAALPAGINFANAHSVFIWVNLPDVTALGSGTFGASFLGLVDSAANVMRLANSSGRIAIGSNLAGLEAFTASTSILVNNRWGFIGYVYNGSTTAFYSDGLPVATTAGNTIGFSSATNVIGSYGGAAVGTITGSLASARLYNRALSGAEAYDLYASAFMAEEEMPALFLAAAGGSFIPAWAMNSNLPVIGTGTY